MTTPVDNLAYQAVDSMYQAFKALGQWPDTPGEFTSYYALALSLGEPMVGSALPPTVKPGRKKECYHNAAVLCVTTGWALDYYEGYAVSPRLGIPICHAWAVDPTDGTVIDNTWGNPQDCHYLGVRIDYDVWHEATDKSGENSIFESDWLAGNWFLHEGWKLLTRASELELA